MLDAFEEETKTYDTVNIVSSLAPEDVGAAINAMLADHDGLVRMSWNALEVARLEFYWEKESQKLIYLYEEILSNYKAKRAI